MSDDLVEIARGSHGEVWYADEAMKEPRLLQHVLADEITRLRAERNAEISARMKAEGEFSTMQRRIARQRRALAKLYQRRNDKNHRLQRFLDGCHAALATARREGMEAAAQRLEELHKNHNYDAESGTLTRKLGRYDRWPESAKTAKLEHDTGYYRAIAEGVAHIRAAAGEGK